MIGTNSMPWLKLGLDSGWQSWIQIINVMPDSQIVIPEVLLSSNYLAHNCLKKLRTIREFYKNWVLLLLCCFQEGEQN